MLGDLHGVGRRGVQRPAHEALYDRGLGHQGNGRRQRHLGDGDRRDPLLTVSLQARPRPPGGALLLGREGGRAKGDERGRTHRVEQLNRFQTLGETPYFHVDFAQLLPCAFDGTP